MNRTKINFARLRVLLVKEIVDLARDRKVLFAAILLPALLFPLLLGFSGKLFRRAEQSVTQRAMRVGLIGDSANLDRLVSFTERATWAKGGTRERVRNGELDAVVQIARANGSERYLLTFDASRESSRSARDRLVASLERVLREERGRLLARASKGRLVLPAREIEENDVASAQRSDSAQIPRLLPMLIVLILLSASAFAAIDLFPGERERGTLETLLVQPMLAVEVLIAKYAAVFFVGVTATVANLIGMAISSFVIPAGGHGLSIARLACLLGVSLPLSIFISAFLVRVVARARSVREAQNYLLPLTLVCLLPPFMAGSPEVPFDGVTAALPLAGPALAFREIALGHFPVFPMLVMLASTLSVSGLVLFGSLKHLANEEHLLGSSPSRNARPGRGVFVVLIAILGLFSLGPAFRDLPPLVRLGAPLVLFAGLPPFLLGKWAGMPPRQLLGGRAPNVKATIVAICAGIGLAMLAASIGSLQQSLLPLPKSFRAASAALIGNPPPSLVMLLLVFAVLPAVLEELLYRRFLLETLLRSMDTTKAVVFSALLFSLHHLSIFRLAPTFVAGVVLAWLVLTTHAFWTAAIAHGVSNGLIVLCTAENSPLFASQVSEWVTGEAWALIRIPVAIALIVLPKWVLYWRPDWQANARPV